MKRVKQKLGQNSSKSSVTTTTSNPASADGKASNFEELPTPVKSASDKKTYKVIKLPNGLTACLICDYPCIKKPKLSYSETDSDSEDEDSNGESCESEDEDSDNNVETENDDHDDVICRAKPREDSPRLAAAALCVGVGSFSDPKDIQGMAHFLEHMVFMGSEKFPQENDFDSFIKKKGGSDNASTDCETTTFYFEILEKHLYIALDKFAQFFISPLMKKNSMTREREAIESEFQMAMPSDNYRKEQLLCSFAKQESPVNTFAWGNLVTLRDSVKDDHLYKNLHEFRKRHYSAHRMTLAIQARLPMNTLEDFVVKCFSDIPSNQQPADDFTSHGPTVFDTPEFSKLYYVKATQDVTQIDLTWVLPSLLNKYKSKPHQYVSWLLGHEGKGSLFSYLRKKIWALSIYTGNGESGVEHNSMYALFSVSIVLTKEGMEKLQEVIEAVYSYINLLKKIGPQERIFKEIKLLEDTSFRFSVEESAVDLVEDLAESMQYYPPEDYITGSEIYFEYDAKGIKMVLDHLVPDKMNIMVLSRTPPESSTYNKTEKWFGTQYVDLDIPEEWIKKWKSVKPYDDFSMPAPNPYLTKNFDILPLIDNNLEYAEKVVDTCEMELWYKKDEKFGLPIAYYYLYLITPHATFSALTYTMIDMLVVLLNLNMAEDIYPAHTAGLTTTVYSADRGVVIKLSGYNEKIPVVLDSFVNNLMNLKKNMQVEMFDAVKEKMIKYYRNRLLKPTTLSNEIRLKILLKKYWSHMDKAAVICDIEYDQLHNFASSFLDYMYLKALVQGNVAKNTASEAIQKFIKKLKVKPLVDDAYPKFQIVELPKGENCCRVRSFNKRDPNSIITNYYQVGVVSLEAIVKIELIHQIIEEPLFDILRTKEQLGYNVYCTLRDTFGVLGHSISVNAQATKNTTQHVDNRIEEFIKHSNKLLSKMTEKKFSQIKRDLIKTKILADTHLEEEVSRHWSEIISDEYIFDRLKQEVKAIEAVTLKEIRQFWGEFAMKDGKSLKKLSIQVVGFDVSADTVDNDNYVEPECSIRHLEFLGDEKAEKKHANYFIRSFEIFKANLPLYPALAHLKKEV